MQGNQLSERILLALIDQLQDAIFAIKDGRMVYFNKQSTDLFGYTEEELTDHPIIDLIFEDDREEVLERYQARLEGRPVDRNTAFRILTKQGDVRNVKMRIGLMETEEGETLTIGSIIDITDQVKTISALTESQNDIHSILNNMPDVFYRTDMQGIITLMSPSCLGEIGYTPEEMIGQPMIDFYCDPADRERIVAELKAGGGKARQVESCLKHKDGSLIWVSANAYVRLDEHGYPIGIEGIARNITERKEMEEKLAELSRLDDLTKLLNRRSFFEAAEAQIDIAHRYKRPLTVMMLDLDYFKSVNDQYGHKAGDLALQFFADACRELFRKTDIISRMGGEEFAILIPETNLQDAQEMAERLHASIQDKPLVYDNEFISITFSAGMVELENTDQSLDDLLVKADRLLYSAKKQGRNKIAVER